jgi:hypothetical protein
MTDAAAVQPAAAHSVRHVPEAYDPPRHRAIPFLALTWRRTLCAATGGGAEPLPPFKTAETQEAVSLLTIYAMYGNIQRDKLDIL